MKTPVLLFLSLLLSVIAMAQSEPLPPLHVSGNRLCDSKGNHITLHGVMDTPSPYFNRHRWGYVCNDTTARAAIAYYDKIFAALNNPRKGTFCDIFRLHLEPAWTNDPAKQSDGREKGEADISRFSDQRLSKYLDTLYMPIAEKALRHGLYVVVRPPGVCPHTLQVGDAYQQYLKEVWHIVSSNTFVKAHSGVISLELANEPVRVCNSEGKDSESALRDYFQPVVDVIRSNGFKGVLWIPGSGYQSHYENYATYPIADSNFGYAVHVYPGWYGASDEHCSHEAFIANFEKQVPVVRTHPILVSEIDWSPPRPGKGKLNEFGQWIPENLGSWGTATTSRWGNAWKAVMDHFGNISMTLTSTDDFLDIDTYLKTGNIKPGLEGHDEACGKACFKWYKDYAKKKRTAGITP